jgi:hypothetical protein
MDGEDAEISPISGGKRLQLPGKEPREGNTRSGNGEGRPAPLLLPMPEPISGTLPQRQQQPS